MDVTLTVLKPLSHGISENASAHLLRPRSTKLCIDLTWVNHGKDHRNHEHEQRVEDVEERFVRDEVAVVACVSLASDVQTLASVFGLGRIP